VRFITGMEGMSADAKYSDWLQQLLGRLLRHFADAPEWATGGRDIGRFKIIAPRREGTAGVNDINQRMHELAKKHWGVGNSQFLVGEPVMISENIHALGLNNGDVGIISEMARSKRTTSDEVARLQATFLRGATAVSYPLEQLTGRFERAWASTCHKAQGSEYDAVFIVLPEGNCDLVTNQWLYTAMTRAKTRLTIIRSHRG
jgi:exodeoxyribonuclease V alpha subunit